MHDHDPNDPAAPITPQLLFEHVAGLRAEVAALREATTELKGIGQSLTNELLELRRWREQTQDHEKRLQRIELELELERGNGVVHGQ